ncbi:hypothetical protein G3A_07035 [Bacillus sp. 17376]|uniref:Transposase C n=1 Tax=Mesobacillus boroniphilus JCM 21738 TaxID=1294265 RepID=W4RPZ9_9BACI|nr:DUF6262 family protein [Mesobacillus boroniphilus]ESU33267.1 hypothetical protein G3A_07035 [Bacillus sp. 17376]GAE46202.1 transposase C [Mesobacillus boroniphilus JCM 21738]
MTNYDRKEQLKKIHQSRKASTALKVDEAIKRLIKSKDSINFNSVAKEAGLSKATLYNNQELRHRIESLRLQQISTPSEKQMKRNMDDNNKDALIESLKRKVKKLENENKELREQVKFAYAEVYKKI